MKVKSFLVLFLSFNSFFIFPQLVDFNSTKVCYGEIIEFKALTDIPEDSILEYYWDLDNDGYYNDTTGKVFNHKFERADTFYIGLLVQTIGNNEYIIENAKPVIVHPIPAADFSSEFLCENLTSRFKSNSTIRSGSIIDYIWSVDNLEVLEAQGISEFSHQFNETSEYDIKLELASNFGCKSSIEKTIKINEAPVSDFSFTSTCLGDTVQFNNESFIQSDTIIKYLWKFGDGAQQFVYEPEGHEYTAAQTYDVTLIAISKHQCADTMVKQLTIEPPNELVLTFNGDTVFYEGNNVTIYANGNFENYLWSTGENTSSIVVNETGIYSVIATDNRGCRAHQSVNILVKDAFNKKEIIAENTVITPNNDGMNDYLRFKDLDAYGSCKLLIYNQWGIEIESIEDYQNDWSGTSKGEDLGTGTYFYIIQGDNLKSQGSINILREGNK